jgi:hypothetical protein
MTDELMCVNNKLTWKFMNTRSFLRASESFSDDKFWTSFFLPSHLDNVETIIPLAFDYLCSILIVTSRAIPFFSILSAYLLAFKLHFMIIPSKFHLTDVEIMVSYNLVREDSQLDLFACFVDFPWITESKLELALDLKKNCEKRFVVNFIWFLLGCWG